MNYRKKQFSVGQMISTCHRTDDIQYWLQLWIRSRVPIPREVVVNGSPALLNAISRTFTLNQNIRDYAAKIMNGEVPPCFIRLDANHFIHTYARFLKIFWMAVIGQLVMRRTPEKAKDILRSMFIVAKSKIEEKLLNGEWSSCEIHKNKLETLITGIF